MQVLKRTIGIICAIVITAYLFVHISYMLRAYERLIGYYAMEEDTVDVVILGTSTTFSSLMPMEAWNDYGMASYVYGSNALLENSMRYSLREIEKTQSPQLIVIDIAPFMYGHDALYGKETEGNLLNIKYNLDSMKYSLNRVLLTRELVSYMGGDFFDFLYFYFDISRYHTNEINPQKFNNSVYDVGKGYGYMRRNEGPSFDPEELYWVGDDELPLEKEHEELFEKFLDEVDRQIEKNGCEVAFFCGPVLFDDVVHFARKNYIGHVLTDRGYTWWDMSKDVKNIDFDYDLDFWNWNHFDSFGAEKTSAFIYKKIAESYDIPDRRNDPTYSAWHDDYEAWCELKKEYNEDDLEAE